jgi:tRNA G10  N-methylase Trm11
MFGAFALGGDVDDCAVDCAAANAAAAAAAASCASRGMAALARWTVRRLPLRAGCADVVVTDLPFGVHCKAKGVSRNGLYAWVANEVCVATARWAKRSLGMYSRVPVDVPLLGVVRGRTCYESYL